jgi:hypothetical protein
MFPCRSAQAQVNKVFSHPVDSAHIYASAYLRITADRCCYQAPDKQSASLTLSIGRANTLYNATSDIWK